MRSIPDIEHTGVIIELGMLRIDNPGYEAYGILSIRELLRGCGILREKNLGYRATDFGYNES